MVSRPKHRRLLAKHLRIYRKRSGLTQKTLAKKAGVHPVYISALERGVETVSVATLVRISKVLKVRVTDLCKGF